MKLYIVYFALILLFPISFYSQNDKALPNTAELVIDENSLYLIYETVVLSSDAKEIDLNVIVRMKILKNNIELDERQLYDAKYYTKATVNSFIRSITGSKTKEELSELRQVDSNIQDELTESLPDLNNWLTNYNTEVDLVDLTLRN